MKQGVSASRITAARPSPALVVAFVALFVALSGSALALKKNSVKTKAIKDAAVTNPKLADGAVTNPKLADGAVNSAKVANNSLTGGNIDESTLSGVSPGGSAGGDLTGSYPNPSIANGAVGTSEVSSSIPAVHVTHSANQSVVNTGNLALAFNTEQYDTASMHDTATNSSRLVAPVTGIYEVSMAISWGSAAGGARLIHLRKNGTSDLANQSVASTPDAMAQSVSASARLVAGDYVEAVAHQTSGASLDVVAGADDPVFSMTWLAPGP